MFFTHEFQSPSYRGGYFNAVGVSSPASSASNFSPLLIGAGTSTHIVAKLRVGVDLISVPFLSGRVLQQEISDAAGSFVTGFQSPSYRGGVLQRDLVGAGLYTAVAFQSPSYRGGYFNSSRTEGVKRIV